MAVAIKVSINIYHGTVLTAGNTAVPFRVVSTQRYPLRYFVAIGRADKDKNGSTRISARRPHSHLGGQLFLSRARWGIRGTASGPTVRLQRNRLFLHLASLLYSGGTDELFRANFPRRRAFFCQFSGTSHFWRESQMDTTTTTTISVRIRHLVSHLAKGWIIPLTVLCCYQAGEDTVPREGLSHPHPNSVFIPLSHFRRPMHAPPSPP